VIVLANEPGELYRDFAQQEPLLATAEEGRFDIIQPEDNPVDFGVEVTTASPQGLELFYRKGVEQGEAYLGI
jgi:hypothetical protein